MKVTVNTNLNVRVGKPSLNAPCYQYLAPGSVLEIDGKLYKGDSYDGIDTWYKDEAGNYYWSGGIEINDLKNDVKQIFKYDPFKMSWVHDSVENGGLGIVDLWNLMGVRGEGVNVAVIDTGIINHEDFTRDGVSIIKGSHYRNGLTSIIDSDGHGTNSASIIAATGNNKTFGIAPGANLYIIKSSENQYVSKERFLEGLKLINQEWPIDIISVSYCFKETFPDFENHFASINENCFVLSALSHTEGNSISINQNQYPASYKNVIPVVAIKKNLIDLQTPSELIDVEDKHIWGFPGEDIIALNENGVCQEAQQTSIATPLGSGIIAIFLSYMKKKKIPINGNNIMKLKDLLYDTATLTDITINERTIAVAYINPLKVFKQFDNSFKN